MNLKSQALEAKILAQATYDNFKTQNLPEAETQIGNLKTKIENIEKTYQQLKFYQNLPIANNYYQDGQHAITASLYGVNGAIKAIDAIVPYADVLGFQGTGSFTGGTAEDRIKMLLETLDKVTPVFDSMVEDLTKASEEIAKINAKRYPIKFKTFEVRSSITQAQDISKNSLQLLKEFRPVIQELPNIAGGRGQRKKYLILFQNDNELRPTGGFLTAYAVIFAENGKVYPEKSDDIYELDKKFTKKIAMPEALKRYLTTEKIWHLRDMNISPDFKTSMDQFMANYKSVKGEPQDIDGIIAVDTHVLTKLLTVLGPVEVPGYGTFSAEIDKRCDCPQIVYALSEIITKPTSYIREDRKGIIGPLMAKVLQKTYSAGKGQWPQLFQLAWESLEGKHVQMYFMDESAQKAAEAVNAAGRMQPEENIDFLAIVDANLGGAKSNLFTNYEVKQTISAPQNGIIKKTISITYRNTHKADNCNLEAGKLCLNSTLHDWLRLYLPKGSKLVESNGFTMDPKQYDEAGFTVIDGFFKLEPMAAAKIVITYEVPYQDTKTYKVKIWKQGGIDPIKTIFDVNGGEEEITIDKDLIYEAAF